MKTFVLSIVVLASSFCFAQQQRRVHGPSDLRAMCLDFDKVGYDYGRLLDRFKYGEKVRDGGVVHDIHEVTSSMLCAGYFDAVFDQMRSKLFVGEDGASIVIGNWKEGATPDDLMLAFELYFDKHPMEFYHDSTPVNLLILKACVDRNLYTYAPFKPAVKDAK